MENIEEQEVVETEETNESQEEETQAVSGQEQEDQQESEESAASEKESDEEEKAKPKRKGAVKRINQLTKEKKIAQQEAEYWRKLALEGKNEKPKEENKAKSENGEPKEDDFESHADYLRAVARFEAKQERKTWESEQKQREQQNTQNQIINDFQKRVEKFSESTPDFEEVMEEADDIDVAPHIEQMLIEADNGPALMYALAKEPDEALRINSLSPYRAAIELGKLEARLETSSKEKPKLKTTKAPKPISSAKGSGSTAKSIHDPNISQKEYERLRMKQMKASGF